MSLIAIGLLLASIPGHPGQDAKAGRLSLVPLVSDERLEDIQESPDGTRLLTHDRGYAPRLWDPRSMKILKVLGGHASSVNAVSFSPKGEWIVLMENSSLSIWDSLHGRKQAEIAPPKEDRFTAFAVSIDGQSVAAATEHGKIGVFPTVKPKDAKWWDGSAKEIKSLEFAPDGASLLSGGVDRAVRTWKRDGSPLATCSGPTETVLWANYSNDGKQILATAVDNTARLFDAGSGKQLFQWDHLIGEKGMMPNTLMSALFVQKDGSGVLVAGSDGTMHVYDRHTGQPIRDLKGHTGPIREIRKSRDGARVGTYSVTEELKLWDAESGKEMPFTRPEGNPTAGEFSPNGDVFWVGYGDGTIRRHELATGAIRSETPGQIRPISAVQIQNGRLWTVFQTQVNGLSVVHPNYLWSTASLETPGYIGDTNDDALLSKDGVWAMISVDGGGKLANMTTGDRYNLKNFEGGVFSPDSKFLVTYSSDGECQCWNLATLKPAWSLLFKDEAKVGAAFYSDDSGVVGFWHLNGDVELRDASNGDSLAFVGNIKGSSAHGVIGRQAQTVVTTSEGIKFWAIKDKKFVEHFQPHPAGFVGRHGHLSFTSDEKSVALSSFYETALYAVETGELLFRSTKSGDEGADSPGAVIHPTKPWVLGFQGASVAVWDYNLKAMVGGFVLSDACRQAFFTEDGSRIITVDLTDSVSVWDADKAFPTKLGSFCVAEDGSWLVLDPQGRFDAHDPSHITGATYVLDWTGGLEPIEVSQLKAQFYEPDLLAKILGQNKEPRRPTPDLSSLHLFPTVKVTFDGGKVKVSLQDRDEGGIGKLILSINGKQVALKDGIGFAEFDASQFGSVMLPESQLDGHGNIASVQAWNEDGTLASLPVSVDIGVPKELKTPPVNLYALCVGVGKYSGSGKANLHAPPSDAEAISSAIQTVAKRLLPERVHISTLASGTERLPTKTEIRKWFEETASQATSSDIVFIFLAGHGTNQIAGRQDYYFLTAEADPTDLNAASAQTGAVSGEELRTMLGKIAANKQVVILDTCHSGAAATDLVASRSVSSEYQRAYEGIKDATGTWLLAGAAADQLSYESSNVDHGMLSYALLEAIDQTQPNALRSGEGGDLFVDVERWLTYAANRVESLKNEVGVPGIQRPELRRSLSRSSFDIGVLKAADKGIIGLKPPKPIVIVGNFQKDEEDPIGLEPEIAKALDSATSFKPWFEVAKHPNVFRIAGSYDVSGDKVVVKIVFQRFDEKMNRKTLETVEVTGSPKDPAALAAEIRKAIEQLLPKYTGSEG